MTIDDVVAQANLVTLLTNVHAASVKLDEALNDDGSASLAILAAAAKTRNDFVSMLGSVVPSEPAPG